MQPYAHLSNTASPQISPSSLSTVESRLLRDPCSPFYDGNRQSFVCIRPPLHQFLCPVATLDVERCGMADADRLAVQLGKEHGPTQLGHSLDGVARRRPQAGAAHNVDPCKAPSTIVHHDVADALRTGFVLYAGGYPSPSRSCGCGCGLG